MFSIELNDQVAWVTGGSRGIGKATTLALAQAGCHVAIGFHSKEAEAVEVANQVRALGRKAMAVQADIGSGSAMEAAYEKISSELGPVEILVNSAGVIADNLFMMLEDEDWQKVLNTNIMGTVHAIKATVRGMMMKRRGRIINLSSVAATKGGRGQANYAASKGAVEAMTRSLAVELASRNITVNCVAPGVIETDMTQEVVRLAKDEILDRQLVKRLGRPDEIAAWTLFLASKYGEFVTGQVIHVDGGMKMP